MSSSPHIPPLTSGSEFPPSMSAASASSSGFLGSVLGIKDYLVQRVMRAEEERLPPAEVLAEENSELRAEVLRVEQEMVKAHREKAKLMVELDEAKEDVQWKANQIIQLQEQVRELQRINIRSEGIRRKLHAQVEELKGQIRVYCRVKPRDDTQGDDIVELDPTSDNAILVRNPKSNQSKKFTSDRVFPESTSQEELFEQVQPLIQCVLDGTHVTILAYGQTGSGKTHTMEGPSECLKNLNSVELEKSLGIIPRAIAFMFNKFSELEACGWTYSCSLSFMEIYNEDVFDLRSNSKSPLQISGEDFVVQGLSEIEVHNVQQAFDEFIKAKTGRRTSATAMNDVSSRSHSIFQMKLTGRNEIEGITCFGKLNLVDLAGSESHEAAKSSVQQAEGANIRKSLLALAKVMRHIHEGSSSPPFRESNLTKILKKSMLNGSKTLMVVTLANEESCKSETSRSASFAHEISRCKSTKDVPKTTIKSPRESSRVPK